MSRSEPIPYTPEVEVIPADEGDDIAAIARLIEQMMHENANESGQFHRDVHRKQHGCARGELQVLEGLSPELRQGLFARPIRYEAFLRFSNSSPIPLADVFPDGRGVAMQVELADHNVPGAAGTQDFLMVNHHVFVARDTKDYLRLQQARRETGQRPVRGMLHLLTNRGTNPLAWRWQETLSTLQVMWQIPRHPANYTYYSMVPIRYGRFVAKYRLKPKRPVQVSGVVPALTDSDAMRHLLERSLQREALVFEFQIQLRNQERSMPVEDATVAWSESESPFQTVATMTLPPQDITLLRDEGERRSFSVWNCLPDHQPLGGINRSRRAAYSISATLRNSSEQNVSTEHTV